MPNKTLTNTEVAVTAIAVLHNNSYMLKVIDKQHSKEFGKTGAQIGSTYNIKRPWRPVVSRQTALVVQNFAEDLVPLTLQYPYQVGLNFTDAELALSIQDFRKQVLDPALPAMATAIDLDGLGLSLNGFRQIGTPGTLLGTTSASVFTGPTATGTIANYTSPAWPLFAGALLDDQSAPNDVRREIICSPWTMAQTASGLSGLYNDQKLLAEQFKTGIVPNGTLGFNWAKDQNIRNITCGNRSGSPLVLGASQVGSNLVTNGWTSGQVNTLNPGEIIMVQGIYHVNPENQQALTTYYATFVVTALCSSDLNGNMTIPIYPAITPAVSSSAYGTVNASPASGATITTMSGSSNTSYPVNVIFHGDAFTMGTAELVMPSGIDFAARETYDGVTILITRAYDITNLQFPARCDILAGYCCTRPELITRGTN
jgi:hypothetical protein